MKNKIVMNLQLFAASKTGVYPCYENQFQIDTAASGGTASLKKYCRLCNLFRIF